MELLKRWSKISEDDAFHLLSNAFCANNKYSKQNVKPVSSMKAIRQYAVNILSESSNKQLCDFMLQLVQALRYECFQDSSLASMLTERSLQHRQVATLYYWYLRAESEYIPNPKDLQAELNHEICEMYEEKLTAFVESMKERTPEILAIIEEQVTFVGALREIAKYVKGMKKDVDKKKEELRNRIVAIDWKQFKNLLLPLNT